MAVLRTEDFESFLKRKTGTMNGVLIHGSDEATIAALARKAAQAVMASDESSSGILRFEMSFLKDDPSRLLDEFYALSLLGDRRVLLIEGADESALKFLAPVIASTSVANFIVLTAENLSKSSKLRVACEGAELFGSLVIYDENEVAQAARIRKLFAADQLSWVGDAEQLFYATVGTDRAAVDQEAAKLALYCLGNSHVTEENVEAICGDTAAFGTDELIDAVLAGDLEAADRMGSSLDTESAGARGVLPVLLLHLTRLQALHLEMERGATIDMVVRNSKPTIFFKRQNAFKSQLKKLDLESLIVMQQNIATAILQSRKNADLWEAITNRALLSLARSARN